MNKELNKLKKKELVNIISILNKKDLVDVINCHMKKESKSGGGVIISRTKNAIRESLNFNVSKLQNKNIAMANDNIYLRLNENKNNNNL